MRSLTTKAACDLCRVCFCLQVRPAMLVITTQSCLGLHTMLLTMPHAMLHIMMCTPHHPNTTCSTDQEGCMHLHLHKTLNHACKCLPMGASRVVEAQWHIHLEASVHGALAAAAGACAVPRACLLICHAMPADLWSAIGCTLTCRPALHGAMAGFCQKPCLCLMLQLQAYCIDSKQTASGQQQATAAVVPQGGSHTLQATIQVALST